MCDVQEILPSGTTAWQLAQWSWAALSRRYVASYEGDWLEHAAYALLARELARLLNQATGSERSEGSRQAHVS